MHGFVGATSDNASTTLGREGSDYSSGLFTAMLGAKSVSIWKDVEGFLNADPKQFSVFVTPSHHRVHYASNGKYLDKNIGMFLIVWDKLFGTFQKEPENQYEPIHSVLKHPPEKQNGFQLIFHEWIQILKDISSRDMSLKEKFKYTFGKPGYSYDGSRKTSAEPKEEEKKKQDR